MRNSSRTYLHRENAAFAQSIPAGSRILDAGAGDQPYRSLFEHCRYEAADFEAVDKPYAKSTYVCDLAQIPVEDGRFDAALFNQVMEHLPNPGGVLSELYRVLRPGGRMICTAPLFYEEHEQPYDFYRYTQFGWQHLMREAGFEIERLDWMEGYFGTLAYQLQTAAKSLPRRPALLSPGPRGWFAASLVTILKPLFRSSAALFASLDEETKFTKAGYPKNYIVLVRKPA